jgi:superfamily II DNA/RNA helicase
MFTKIDGTTKNVCSIIAQSKNGSGKTGAFVVGSLLRVDPELKAP